MLNWWYYLGSIAWLLFKKYIFLKLKKGNIEELKFYARSSKEIKGIIIGIY